MLEFENRTFNHENDDEKSMLVIVVKKALKSVIRNVISIISLLIENYNYMDDLLKYCIFKNLLGCLETYLGERKREILAVESIDNFFLLLFFHLVHFHLLPLSLFVIFVLKDVYFPFYILFLKFILFSFKIYFVRNLN